MTAGREPEAPARASASHGVKAHGGASRPGPCACPWLGPPVRLLRIRRWAGTVAVGSPASAPGPHGRAGLAPPSATTACSTPWLMQKRWSHKPSRPPASPLPTRAASGAGPVPSTCVAAQPLKHLTSEFAGSSIKGQAGIESHPTAIMSIPFCGPRTVGTIAACSRPCWRHSISGRMRRPTGLF